MQEVVLTADEVAAVPMERLSPELDGVRHAILWREKAAYGGVMRVASGYQVPPHRHRRMAHHIWVTAGTGRVQDRILTAGSYCYVPIGALHAIDGLPPDGCTFFYLHLPPAADLERGAEGSASAATAATV